MNRWTTIVKCVSKELKKKMQEMDGEFMSIVATTPSNLTVKKTNKEEVKMSNVIKPGGLTGIRIGLTWNLRKNFKLIVKHLILFLTG